MRTKRKRACKKSPARKSAAVARNGKATNQSEKAVNQNKEAFLTSINKINKEDSVSADSNDLEVIDKCDSDPDDAKRNSSSSSSSSDSDESFSAEDSSSGDSQSIDRRSRKSTKGHGNGKQKATKLPKKGRKDDVKRQDEFKMPQQDPRYNKKELEAALEVIKKIMKMDEAQPFNVPVDPVASGKPVRI
ncbi:bromodomain-containing protein 2-like isoform X2 [Gossypium australe]|uniref:Bromodomain-containing protein 2-like isoform X2 n=1 Tax=Gossypium australe TaxID=47621 RepID=A0A5B6UWF8_9ROSI|nr:bromodomain-containing protein 2-like isoform X2 [Gossypium australe]